MRQHVPGDLNIDFLLQVLNAVQTPVFVKDELFRFSFFNDAFCALLGRTRAELLGRTDFDVVPPEQATIFRNIDVEILASGIPHENEEALTNQSGTQFWIVTRKSLLEIPGRGRYIVGVISDITERKQIERDLRVAKVQAEQANRARSQFLANMSHELRTPLNAIIGFSSILKKDDSGTTSESKRQEYLEDIHGSGVHLLHLINDILDLTKIEAGKYELREQECDVVGTISEAVRLLSDTALHKCVHIEQSADADMPAVTGDPRAIRQILLNLISNAVKFTPCGGTVTINARLDPDLAIVLSVSDTGIGMAPEEIPIALSSFNQVDGTWGRRYEGAGLGLPMVKALVELHAGTLNIESQVSKGTTVSVRFPPHRTAASTHGGVNLHRCGR
jgi:PAS domain S-box-containing protein